MITLYRRHSKDCREKLVKELKLPLHAHRQYRDCDCLIWMEGTTNDARYDRQSTKLRDWAAAEALVRSMTAEAIDTADHGPTMTQAITRYIDSRADELGVKTANQYRLVLTRLAEYAAARNVIHIGDISVDLCKDFVTYGLKAAKNTKATYAAKLKAFFSEAYDRRWIKQPIILNRMPTATYEPAEPFTDAEVRMIFDAAEKLNGGTHAYATHPKTFRLLLQLMHETGMRCGDAIRFDPQSVVKSQQLFKYVYQPQKTRKAAAKKLATVYLTESLYTAILNCKWMSYNRPFAYLPIKGANDKTTYMANEVYERMKAIGQKCKDANGNPVLIEDCRPHRFRDTYAVRLLEKGMSLDAVSKLLNHNSVVVTEKHYAKWVQSRLNLLETQLAGILGA